LAKYLLRQHDDPNTFAKSIVEKRVSIETLISRNVYGLTREDMEHILGTFVYGTPDKKLMQAILDSF
jgi:hypothetical protein